MHIANLAVDVDHLVRAGGLLDRLEALLPEPVADPTTGTTSHHKVTGSPAPWHTEAAVRRVQALIDSYPPGSQFARSGAQALFRAALDAEQPKETR